MTKLLAVAWVLASVVAAGKPDVQPGSNSVDVTIANVDQSEDSPDPPKAGTGRPAIENSQTVPVVYAWRNPCVAMSNTAATGAAGCPVNNCPPGEQIYQLWQIAPPPAHPLRLVCSGNGEPALPAPPQITNDMVLQAFRRIPVPALRAHSQPADKTLINFATIFYTEAEPFTRHVTLLGQDIRLEIAPSSFTWHHGDGTTATTRTPGAPYPAKTITHRYTRAHTTVSHHLVTTWTAQWSLNGGPLQPVNGTVTTTGPSSTLRIAEASPVLSGAGH